MKQRILLLMMTALLSVGAWAADDLTLNPSETVIFGDWGFSNEKAPTLNFGNWSAGGGWQFKTALSQDDYCGVDFTFEATTEKHVIFFIDYEGGAEQSIDVPTGSTSIKADFAYTGGITKIGFKYGDYETDADKNSTANPNGASITITSAVVKAHSTGEVVELAFADLNDETKDVTNKAINLQRYNSAPSWTFNPALSSGDYEKLVVTFAEAIPEEGLTVTLNGKTFTGLVCGATKATAYFTSGVSIESIGFSYGWNSKQGDTDEAPTATLKIAKVELVKKASDTPTEPTTDNVLVKDDDKTADPDDAHTEVYTLGTGTDAKTLTIKVEKTADSENSGTYKTNGTISASATTKDGVTTVTLTPDPATGYKLSKLIIEKTADAGFANARTRTPATLATPATPATGDFITATKKDDGTWTFTMPESSVIISATFADKPQKPTLAYNKATRTITITNEAGSAGKLHYKLNSGDGQTTTDASASKVITVNTTVTAWITNISDDDDKSDEVEGTFNVTAAPTATVNTENNTVTLQLTTGSTESGANTAVATLYYTTDGSDPTTTSASLTSNGIIDITEDMTTVKVLALDADGNYSEIVEQSVAYTYSLTASKEWTTYYHNYSKTFSVPDGLKAYTVTSVTAPSNGQSGTIEVAEQQVIAPNTPMLIYNEGATTTYYTLTVTTDATISGTADEFADEFKFIGVATATNLTNDGKLRYVLVDGVFLRTTGGTLPANRCYLEFGSTSAQARSFSINVGDNTTAIETVGITPLKDEGQWYDLQGRRVMQPQKGIYIRNGKKVVVR